MKPNTISTGHCFSKWRCHCFSKWRCAASRGHHACAPTPRFCKSSLTLEKVPRCSQRCPCAPKRRPPQEVLRFLLKPTFELLKGDKYRKFGLRSQIFSARRSNALPSISWWTCRHEQRAIKHLPDVCTFPMCRCQRDATWERNPAQRGPLDKDSAMCRQGSPFEACNRSIVHLAKPKIPEADAGKVIQSQILPLQARCLSTGAVLADLADLALKHKQPGQCRRHLALKHKQPGQCRRRGHTSMSGNSVGLSPSLCAPQPGDDKMGSFYIELQLRLLGARAHMLRSQGDGRHEQCWVERDRAAGRVRGLRVGLGEEVRRSLTLAGTPITLPASGISNP